MLCTNLWTGENVKFGEWEGLYAISINCFVSHHPTDPRFFKVPFKENKTDPNFFKFLFKKNVFNLKELYYFEIIILVFFSPTDRPNLSSGGRWETKHCIGMAK